MRHGVFLPLIAVWVGVAAVSGTIHGTVVNGAVATGALITAHVCAGWAGWARVPVFAAVFVTLPTVLSIAIAAATQLTVMSGGAPAFEAGQVTRAGLLSLLGFNATYAAVALAVDALAMRFLPR